MRSQADLERLEGRARRRAARSCTRAKELRRAAAAAERARCRRSRAAGSAEAQLKSLSEAQVTQAQASLNQNQVNLEHTVIKAPIDGLVISRNVDVGQTVAASMQAPTLFVLAADLTKMQVVANLDESDVGRIRPDQIVTFRVDAYPNETFHGTVSQVRLEADRAAERRHLRDGHRRAEQRSAAEAGHDGERQRRNRAEQQRAARAELGAAIPADQRDVRGARPDAAGPRVSCGRLAAAAAAANGYRSSGFAAPRRRPARRQPRARLDSSAHQVNLPRCGRAAGP